ncbi:MAG: HDOD domain-containing protein [Gammaproteobacteria bacterium]|nr:MAG: HDOD domain-containing protein [Gammaproteobacteria bacterium]
MGGADEEVFGTVSGVTPRELVAGAVEVASLPEVYHRLAEMIDSPRHSAADIARVLEKDPGLTARLLRIANSAFYGFPSQIDTVSRAITVIGTRELRDLVLATCVVRLFKGLPNDLVTMDDFWRHSIGCGLAARALAAQRGERLKERHFVAGLLHDIGALIVYAKLPELAREALLRARHQHQPIFLAERAVMGFDHGAVGCELMRKWKLPEHLQEAAAFHHEPEKAPVDPRDVAMVHLADRIAEAMGLGSSGEPLPEGELAADRAWGLAELDPGVVEAVTEDVDRRYEETLRLLAGDDAPPPLR